MLGQVTAPTRGPRHLRTVPVAALAVVALLGLSGCVRMDMDLTLSEDDTASGTVVVAFSDRLAEAMGTEPQELWQQGSDALAGELPEGATEQPYAEDGYTGGTYTFTEQPIGEIGGLGGEELSITREGDEYVVTGTMDLTDDTGELESAPPELVDEFDVRVAVTFPGEVVETDGEVLGTNTVEWRPPVGERTEMRARGSAVTNGMADASGGGATDGDDAASPGFPWWVVGALGGVLLLAVVVVLALRARRGGPGGPSGGGGDGPVLPTGPPPGPRHDERPLPPLPPDRPWTGTGGVG